MKKNLEEKERELENGQLPILPPSTLPFYFAVQCKALAVPYSTLHFVSRTSAGYMLSIEDWWGKLQKGVTFLFIGGVRKRYMRDVEDTG